jgi:hypothetical protein
VLLAFSLLQIARKRQVNSLIAGARRVIAVDVRARRLPR